MSPLVGGSIYFQKDVFSNMLRYCLHSMFHKLRQDLSNEFLAVIFGYTSMQMGQYGHKQYQEIFNGVLCAPRMLDKEQGTRNQEQGTRNKVQRNNSFRCQYYVRMGQALFALLRVFRLCLAYGLPKISDPLSPLIC